MLRIRDDASLVKISEIVSDNPKAALMELDSIDKDKLSENDRYYFELLRIKANDKAFICHTSDSIVLKVIDYYSGHDEDNLYAEALYYGGRVNHDMGDYPSALYYYQNALDLLPPDPEHNRLRGKVLSMTTSVLNKLRLYGEAIPYIKEAVNIDRQLNDSVSLMYAPLFDTILSPHRFF